MTKDTPNNHTYGIITKVLTKASKKASHKGTEKEKKPSQIFYTVQCYDHNNKESNNFKTTAKPKLRKCHVPKETLTNNNNNNIAPATSLQSVALAVDDMVLIEPNKNPKTGCILKVYSRTEKAELLQNQRSAVPALLLQRLQEEGYQDLPDVSFDDTVRVVMPETLSGAPGEL